MPSYFYSAWSAVAVLVVGRARREELRWSSLSLTNYRRTHLLQCDEREPVCLNCEKSLRKCPGPLSRFIHHKISDGGSAKSRPELRAKSSRKSTSQPVVGHSPGLAWPQTMGAAYPLGPRSSGIQDLPLMLHDDTCFPLPVPLSPSESLSMRLNHTLHSTNGTGNAISNFVDFLPFVPPRIGHNTALDAAIECMLLAHDSIVHPHLSNEASKLRQYGLALHALRTELDTTDDSPTAETVCAALTICTCEVSLPVLFVLDAASPAAKDETVDKRKDGQSSRMANACRGCLGASQSMGLRARHF